MEFIFAEPDTILVFKIFYEVFRGGTRLAMPKTICAPDSSSLKAWFRGYCGSPGLGGLWTAGLYPLAGLLDYEDTGLKKKNWPWKHDLCFDKMCQGNRFAKRAEVEQ